MFDILSEARQEGLKAARWCEEHQRGLGEQFLDELQAAFERIAADPGSLGRLELYSGHYDVRRYHLKRFPYSAIFYTRRDDVIVVAVCHSRRRPLYWAGRLK